MKNFLFTVVLGLNVFSLFGQGEYTLLKDENIWLAKYAKVCDTINSIECRFVQEKHLSFMEAPLTSEGRFYYKKTANLRWELPEDNYYLLISGEKIRLKEDGLEKKLSGIELKTFEFLRSFLIGGINGDLFKNPNIDFEVYQNKMNYKVNIRSNKKQFKNYLSHIEMVFNKSTNLLEEYNLVEVSGDITKVIIQDKNINGDLKSSIFEQF